MARIRTIKPEFWADEKLAPLDPQTRLVFLGLISMADDCGRVLDNLKHIDAFIFPETEHSARESLATLSRLSRVTRGKTASGQAVIQITNWTRHQRVDRPSIRGSLPQLVVVHDTREELTGDPPQTRETLAHRPTTNDQRPSTAEDDPRGGGVTFREGVNTQSTNGNSGLPDGWLAKFPEPYREPVQAAFRAHHNPTALRAELDGIISGLTFPAYPPDVVGRAIHEMAVTGAKMSSAALRGFCRKIAVNPQPKAGLFDDAD